MYRVIVRNESDVDNGYGIRRMGNRRVFVKYDPVKTSFTTTSIPFYDRNLLLSFHQISAGGSTSRRTIIYGFEQGRYENGRDEIALVTRIEDDELDEVLKMLSDLGYDDSFVVWNHPYYMQDSEDIKAA